MGSYRHLASAFQAEWAVTEEREQEEKERRAEFSQTTIKPARSQLKVLGKTYQVMRHSAGSFGIIMPAAKYVGIDHLKRRRLISKPH